MNNRLFNYFAKIYPIIISISIGIVLIYAVLLFIDMPAELSLLLSNLLPVTINLINLVGMLAASYFMKSISTKTARSYRLWFFAFLFVWIGDICWWIYPIFIPNGSNVLSSGFVDALYLLFQPLFFIGGFTLPFVKMKKVDKIKRTFETAIIVLSAFLAYWVFLILPALQYSDTNVPTDSSYFILYMILNNFLLVVVLRLMDLDYSKFADISSLFMAGSILIYVVSDGIYASLLLTKAEIIPRWLDLGWVVAYLLGSACLISSAKYDLASKRISMGFSKAPTFH